MSVDLSSVQLAVLFDGWPEGTSVLAVEPKLDGFRLTAKVGPDGVRFFCRDTQDSGEVDWSENLGHVAKSLLALGPDAVGCTFDGEVCGETWNTTASLLRTHRANLSADDIERLEKTVRFHAFDLLRDEWGVDHVKHGKRGRKEYETVQVPYHERRTALSHALANADTSVVKLVPSILATDATQVMDLYQDYLELGFEGGIAKQVDAPYVAGRLPYWMKIKPNKTIDLVVDKAVEGAGKHAGRLGALACYEPKSGTKVSVGTGFNDALRQKLWDMRDRLQGLVVEVKVQAGDVALARHPVFIRFREDINATSVAANIHFTP